MISNCMPSFAPPLQLLFQSLWICGIHGGSAAHPFNEGNELRNLRITPPCFASADSHY